MSNYIEKPSTNTHDQRSSTYRYALVAHDADAGLIWSVGGVWSASLLSQSPTLMTGPQVDAFKVLHPNARIVDVIVYREACKVYGAGFNSVLKHSERSTPETRQAAREAGIKALVHAGFSEDALNIANIERSDMLKEQNLQGNVESAKASRAVSLSETTLTFSLPDDFGAGWEYVNQRLHGASHAWAGSYDKSESANFAHEALMQVQGVDSSYLATGMTCNVSFVVNDIAEAVAIQSRLQAVVDAFESKPERSISVRGSNFYDSKVTEYDANDPDVEIVSDMPYLNYLAKYVPLAEALPALSGHDLAALRAEADEHQLAKQVDKDDSPSPGM